MRAVMDALAEVAVNLVFMLAVFLVLYIDHRLFRREYERLWKRIRWIARRLWL